MPLHAIRALTHRTTLICLTIGLAISSHTLQAADQVLSIDSFVPHISTVPANRDQPIGLHLRERVLESVKHAATAGKPAPVVLFVHGGFSPAIVAYDLDCKKLLVDGISGQGRL